MSVFAIVCVRAFVCLCVCVCVRACVRVFFRVCACVGCVFCAFVTSCLFVVDVAVMGLE